MGKRGLGTCPPCVPGSRNLGLIVVALTHGVGRVAVSCREKCLAERLGETCVRVMSADSGECEEQQQDRLRPFHVLETTVLVKINFVLVDGQQMRQ